MFTTVELKCIHLEIKNIGLLDSIITSYVAENASKRDKKPGKSIDNQSSKHHFKNNLFTTVVVYRCIQTKIKSWTMDALDKTSHTHVRHKCFTMCTFKSINQSNDTI